MVVMILAHDLQIFLRGPLHGFGHLLLPWVGAASSCLLVSGIGPNATACYG